MRPFCRVISEESHATVLEHRAVSNGFVCWTFVRVTRVERVRYLSKSTKHESATFCERERELEQLEFLSPDIFFRCPFIKEVQKNTAIGQMKSLDLKPR